MSDITSLSTEFSQLIKENKAKKNRISILRLLTFLAATILFYRYLATESGVLLGLAVLLFVIFIALIFVSSIYQDKIDFAKAQLSVIDQINETYINSNALSPTSENHPFQKDLDVFGQVSLFSKINKTQTFLGAQKLQDYLLNPLISANEISERQKSIAELSLKTRWNINFLALSQLLELQNPKKILDAHDIEITDTPKSLKFLLIFFPLLYASLIIVSLVTGNYWLGSATIILMIAVSYLLAHRYEDKISNAYQSADLKANQFGNFVKLFENIENEKFTEKNNLEIQQKLLNPSASKSLKNLSQQVKNLENGYTNYFGFILNLLFLWNLRYAVKVEALMKELKPQLPLWVEAFAEFEALISFGIYRFKNPKFTEPKAITGYQKLETTSLYHPLIDKENSVGNSFEIGNTENVAIITGANMTGKSTFLRTVGANLVLAMNGLPVDAESFSFQPMKLFTSMRTSDSLNDGSSYFHAEIFRLKEIMSDLENKTPLFIILDEILKGTNSADKLTGSKLFLEKIISLKTPFSCLIATHDLDLTSLASEAPQHVSNYCFELQTIDADLVPDYKIKPGATTSMNALFLMRKFGII